MSIDLLTTSPSGLTISLATPEDDAALRWLLWQTPMHGRIRLVLAREPSFFAAADIEGDTHHTFIARDADRPVACGTRAVRMAYVNGELQRVAYLSGLRIHPGCKRRRHLLREGYAAFEALAREHPVAIHFTSIMADNVPARRLLEAGLGGLPRYEPLGELVTCLLPTRPLRERTHVTAGAAREYLADLIDGFNRRHQLGPHWPVELLGPAARTPGLERSNFLHLPPTAAGPAGCVAVWDQSSRRTISVEGYSPFVRLARPMINLAAMLTGRPRLPRVGTALSLAYASHLAVSDPGVSAAAGIVSALMAAALDEAFGRGIRYLTLGLDARSPLLASIQSLSAMSFRSIIYAVRFPSAPGITLDDRLLHPEIALL